MDRSRPQHLVYQWTDFPKIIEIALVGCLGDAVVNLCPNNVHLLILTLLDLPPEPVGQINGTWTL
jgi:hypothetical protein